MFFPAGRIYSTVLAICLFLALFTSEVLSQVAEDTSLINETNLQTALQSDFECSFDKIEWIQVKFVRNLSIWKYEIAKDGGKYKVVLRKIYNQTEPELRFTKAFDGSQPLKLSFRPGKVWTCSDDEKMVNHSSSLLQRVDSFSVKYVSKDAMKKQCTIAASTVEKDPLVDVAPFDEELEMCLSRSSTTRNPPTLHSTTGHHGNTTTSKPPVPPSTSTLPTNPTTVPTKKSTTVNPPTPETSTTHHSASSTPTSTTTSRNPPTVRSTTVHHTTKTTPMPPVPPSTSTLPTKPTSVPTEKTTTVNPPTPPTSTTHHAASSTPTSTTTSRNPSTVRSTTSSKTTPNPPVPPTTSTLRTTSTAVTTGGPTRKSSTVKPPTPQTSTTHPASSTPTSTSRRPVTGTGTTAEPATHVSDNITTLEPITGTADYNITTIEPGNSTHDNLSKLRLEARRVLFLIAAQSIALVVFAFIFLGLLKASAILKPITTQKKER
ncbi:unnamed protein product [Bursaphelenchus xylophilus]|uniref:(pine wood nematode) hypothetical protein n=1 Tax=Bursaphelenchus xylophilus TaxID=6326 RepID=A0A1I7RW57_BURXY|nr:unnamed protein product [Bursaphelenchus xylophilus]CAG9095156.1 unnamed protein product [Bursaphelenchus xylophilus]